MRYTEKQLLEKKLIDEFKEEFYKQVGYYPIVSTQLMQKNNVITLMSLNELENYFVEFYPYKFGKTHNLRSKARFRELVDLRIIFTQIARTMNYTYYNIGRYLGGRHHTTVLNYSVLFKNLMETSHPFTDQYHNIYNFIKTKKNESSTLESIDQMEC